MTTDVASVQPNDLAPLIALGSAISPLELDGYLTAVIVTPQPEPIPPSAWIMQLWGPDTPIGEDEATRSVLGALMKHYNAVSTKIDRSLKRL